MYVIFQGHFQLLHTERQTFLTTKKLLHKVYYIAKITPHFISPGGYTWLLKPPMDICIYKIMDLVQWSPCTYLFSFMNTKHYTRKRILKTWNFSIFFFNYSINHKPMLIQFQSNNTFFSLSMENCIMETWYVFQKSNIVTSPDVRHFASVRILHPTVITPREWFLKRKFYDKCVFIWYFYFCYIHNANKSW